jgi:molecular chaperone DnaJ
VRSQYPGDLFCHLVVETPVSLTERQRQLLREFEAISQQDSARHNPRTNGWFDKVKQFFEG